jgi:hypothetical protein
MLKNIKVKNTIFSVHMEAVAGIFPSGKCRQSPVLLESNGMIVAENLTETIRMSSKKTMLFCSKIQLPLQLNFWAITFVKISY